MHRTLLTTLGIVFACIGTAAHAASNACPREMEMAAMDVSGSSHRLDWEGMYEAFQTYRTCDDGSIGAGFSDGVVRILANRWESLPQLQDLVEKDDAFRTFVFRHINATTDPRDLKRILLNLTDCPDGYQPLCERIRRETELALSDM